MDTQGFRYPPRSQRPLADVGALLRSGDHASEKRVALMIGAGVDAGLSDRPLWGDLIKQLSGPDIEPALKDALVDVSHGWPIESAEALRTTIGPAAFDCSLRKFVRDGKPNPPEYWQAAIQALLESGLRMVVSLNYTPDFQTILRHLGPELKVKTFDRTHLAAFRQGEIFSPADKTLHLIHLHGRVDTESGRSSDIVLDRRSYDISLGSRFYVDFLRRLFQDYTVITIGMSWNDPALRVVVSQVQFEYPISGRAHLAILPEGKSANDWWLDRALLTSYNVRSVFYPNPDGHQQAPELLRSIANGPDISTSLQQPLDADLPSIADRLDEWGDYESASQSDWMAQFWKPLTDALLRQNADQLTTAQWAALARIERHLRHFLWFYLPHETRVQRRSEIWNRIAALHATLPGAEREKLWQPSRFEKVFGVGTGIRRDEYLHRGVLEYALGAYEVQYLSSYTGTSVERMNWRLALERIPATSPSNILGRRVRLARDVWLRRPTVDDLRKLRSDAVACRWEGMESKLVLDLLQAKFKKTKEAYNNVVARAWPEMVREEILDLAEDARMVARAAGCFRREVGSIVVGSFAQPAHVAEANLLAIRERLLESSGRRYEISMLWWIYVALVAIDYDTFLITEKSPYSTARARQYLEHRCTDFSLGPSSAFDAIQKNSLPHWAEFHERATEHVSGIIRDTSSARA